MSREDMRTYLEGVVDLEVFAVTGSAAEPPEKHQRRHLMRRDLREILPCPAACRSGGYELARDIYERATSKQKKEAQGVIPCKGYTDDPTAGRRKACDNVCAYRAIISYDSRLF